MRRGRTILRTAILGAIVASGSAFAQTPQVPPGAQPGGQQPRDLTSPLPTPSQPFAFEIPPLIDRPLGVDEGARVFVNRFIIDSILDEPSVANLSRDARERIQGLLEQARELAEQTRIERQRLDEVGPDGFSDSERTRILEFMQRVTRDLDPDRGVEDYTMLVDEIRLARLERSQGMTIGQIQQIADAISQIYREDGYFLARAIVPAQDVVDGVVRLRVLEGRLGETIVENNELYSADVVAWTFENLEGGLINAEDVERSLLLLNDMPGIQVFGTFRPGEEVGTSDFVINVQNEERISWDMQADNYGTDFTGRYRLASTFSINNFFGVGDQLTANAMRTFSPTNTTLGGLDFNTPFVTPDTRIGFNMSRNSFDITSQQLQNVDFGGISESASFRVEHAIMRRRTQSIFGQWDFTRKTGDTLQSGQVFNRDELAVMGLQVRYEQIDSEANALESGFLRIDQGFDGVFGVPTNTETLNPVAGEPRFSRVQAVPQFTKVTAGYSRLTAIDDTNTFLLRFTGQFTRDRLSSLEQFAIGGPNQLRGLPTAAFLADRGVFGSFEWFVRAPGFADREAPGGRVWGDILNVGFFVDHTQAWTVDPLPVAEIESHRFTSYGMSLNFVIPGRWSFKLQHAWLHGGERPGNSPTDPARVEDGRQLWAEFSLTFR